MLKQLHLHILILLITLITLGSQCNLEKSPAPSPKDNNEISDAPALDAWSAITGAISRREIVKKIEDNRYEMIVYRFNIDDVVMELNNTSDPLRLDEWADQLNFDLLINGGYFDENYLPTGFLAIDGDILSSKKYSPKKSGLLLIENGLPSIIDTSSADFPAISDTTSVLQSFPLLIKSGGKPGIEEDSNKLARRTVVAQSSDNTFYLIIVDQTPLSLFVMMELLLDSDLNLDVALNLDGGQSSALMTTTEDFNETLLPLTVLPQIISIKTDKSLHF